MRTDETICLNSIVDGKQPYIEDRIYYGGGICVGITATFSSYGCWVLYEENPTEQVRLPRFDGHSED